MSLVRPIIRSGLFALLFLSCSTGFAAQPAMQALQKVLTPISTLKANFKQIVYSESKKVIQESAGNMEFKRPNLFRWQVLKPDMTLVVTDGIKLWNYDQDLEQVVVQKFSHSEEVSPVSFLFDTPEKLDSDFNVTQLPGTKDAELIFKLIPKQENASFTAVEVYFSNSKIKTLKLYDHLAQVSIFDFAQVQTNLQLPAAHFTFVPPAGVDVVGDK